MVARQFAQSGVLSKGPTTEEDSMVLTNLPIDTETSGGASTPIVDDDMNMNRILNATVERTYQISVSGVSSSAVYNGLEAITPSIATVDQDGFTTLVTEGVATFVAKSNMGNRTERLNHSITGGETFDEFVSWVTGSLAEDASDAVDDAIDGLDPTATKPLYTTQDHTAGVYVRNTACWAAEWVEYMTCISPYNSTGSNLRAGTAITPRHIVFANHYPIGVGATVRFVTSDNVVVDRTMTARLRVGTTDFMIGLLDSDLPATITPCQMMADEVATKLPNLDRRIPTLGLDYSERALVQDWTVANSTNYMSAPSDATRYSFYESKISGDSGNPCFVIINGKLVLLTTWFYGGAGSGPATQNYLTEIQAAIDTLGAYSHTLDIVDLSSYPSY